MGITKIVESITLYISEAVARIFSPSDDAYPIIGVQPFSGDPYKKQSGSDW